MSWYSSSTKTTANNDSSKKDAIRRDDRLVGSGCVVSQRSQPVKRRHQGEGEEQSTGLVVAGRDDNVGPPIREKVVRVSTSLWWRGKCFSFDAGITSQTQSWTLSKEPKVPCCSTRP